MTGKASVVNIAGIHHVMIRYDGACHRSAYSKFTRGHESV